METNIHCKIYSKDMETRVEIPRWNLKFGVSIHLDASFLQSFVWRQQRIIATNGLIVFHLVFLVYYFKIELQRCFIVH
jgi:hypothetical protein